MSVDYTQRVTHSGLMCTNFYVNLRHWLSSQAKINRIFKQQTMFTKQDLVALVQHTMPYGKYQGKRISDLPEEYLLWMQRKGFPEGKLGYLLQLMLEIRIHGAEDVVLALRPHYPPLNSQPPAKGVH